MATTNPYYTGLTSGLSSGQSFGNANGFQMNNGGIFGGVASGAASGAAAGPAGAVIGGLVGGVTSFFKQDAQLKEATENVNTAFGGQTDAFGRPVYDGGIYSQGFRDFDGLMEATRPGAHALRPRRRRQMQDKARDLYQNIQTGQQSFNTAESAYRNRQLQLNDYLERQNDQSRLFNLYNR